MSSIYNAYIPGEGPYENIPEEHPPGWGATLSSLLGGKGGGLTSLLQKLGFGKVDSGDLLLMLILFLLWREGDQLDWGWPCYSSGTVTPELSWRTVPSGRENTVPASRGA